ncbi:MAG: O-antigen ligase family protein [Vicinamibacterales bacterium]
MIQAGLIVIIAWGALAFGAVYPWAYTPLLVACAGVGVTGLAWGRRDHVSSANRAALMALLLVGAAGLAQIVALPTAVLEVISPSTDAFLQRYDIGYAVHALPHPLSIEPAATRRGLIFLAVFGLFFAGLLKVFARTGVRRLVAPLAAFGAVLALIAIIQKQILGDHAYMGMKIYGFWTPESRLVVPYGPYVNRNHFAGWMVMAIPVALGYLSSFFDAGTRTPMSHWRTRVLWLSSPDGGKSLLIGCSIILMTLSVGMSMSRSGMACLAVAALLVGWRVLVTLPSRRARMTGAAVVMLLLVLPAAWLGVDSTIDRFSSDAVGSVDTRVRAWRDAVSLIRDFPLTGTGLNTFGTAMVLYQTGSRGVHFEQAHNDFLQLLAEGGALIMLPVLVFTGLAVRAVRSHLARAEDPATSWIRFGAIAGIVGIGLQSLVEFSLQMPGNAAFFVVILAVAMHKRVRRSQNSGRPRDLPTPAGVPVVAGTPSLPKDTTGAKSASAAEDSHTGRPFTVTQACAPTVSLCRRIPITSSGPG